MSDDLNQLFERTRRVMRAGGEGHREEPGAPPGFAERVLRQKVGEPPPRLLGWERAGLVGAAASVVVAVSVHLHVRGQDSRDAARVWMEMDAIEEREDGRS